ncbi:MAG: C45 family peptidase [Candidatus Thorarchaeota archaeon]
MSKMVRLQGSHYEIGLQHGKKLASIIRKSVIPFVRKDMERLRISDNAVGRIIAEYRNLLSETHPEILDETKGIGDGADIDYDTALLVLFYWEVKDTVRDAFPECSSFVATGDATRNGIQIATQNSDWSSEMTNKPIGLTFHISPKGRYSFMGRGLAGNLGRPSVVGFNEKGLAFVGSGIRQMRNSGFGFPPLTATRIGLEKHSTVDEFIDFVRRVPQWSHAGENVDILDKDGNIARIGFSTNKIFVTQARNHFIVSTNHYHNDEMRYLGPMSREVYPSSYTRYETLVKLLTDSHGKIDVERTKQIMSDHSYGNTPPDGAKSICRHGKEVQTRSNIILVPERKECWVADGSPCSTEYSKFTL